MSTRTTVFLTEYESPIGTVVIHVYREMLDSGRPWVEVEVEKEGRAADVITAPLENGEQDVERLRPVLGDRP